MANQDLAEFARLLVQQVRDEAIGSCDRRLHPSAKGVIAERWHKAAIVSSPEDFASEIIPDVVDDTISALLWAMDQGLLRMSFTTSSGRSIDLAAAAPGELTGWYKGDDGWRMKYSKERFIDDNADLRDFFTRDADQDERNDTQK